MARSSKASSQIVFQPLVLPEPPAAAMRFQELGVPGLVVVDRGRERNQHAGHAGGAQFGNGQRAGAADHQIGPGIGFGHVGDEGFDPASTPAS